MFLTSFPLKAYAKGARYDWGKLAWSTLISLADLALLIYIDEILGTLSKSDVLSPATGKLSLKLASKITTYVLKRRSYANDKLINWRCLFSKLN